MAPGAAAVISGNGISVSWSCWHWG